jgi:hypothetical protein
METIIIQTEGSKLKLIKQLLKELGIAFEIGKAASSPYNPEFVAKIKDRSKRASNGEFVVFDDHYKNELFGQ